MKVSVFTSRKQAPLFLKSVQKLVALVLKVSKVACDEVGVHFVSERTISSLHNKYFNDPTPTDCITFPIDDSFLGEIFVCPKIAFLYAKKHRLDPTEELSRYVVHGLLHLIGYDDQTPAKAKKMREREDYFLFLLKEKKLLLRDYRSI